VQEFAYLLDLFLLKFRYTLNRPKQCFIYNVLKSFYFLSIFFVVCIFVSNSRLLHDFSLFCAKKTLLWKRFLVDNPKKCKYNTQPIPNEGDLFLLPRISEIRHLQDIDLSLSRQRHN
jgi:hypothetical protein